MTTRRKATAPETQPSGNVDKFDSYREAWARIKAARENDFYLEAIAIEESILSDRLSSHLKYHGKYPKHRKDRYVSFSSLITAWAGLEESSPSEALPGLREQIDKWREQRNTILHALVKSDAGESPPDVDKFLKGAQEAAEKGERLARRFLDWHGAKVRKAAQQTTHE